jgi:hypothetical protein
VTVDVLAVGGNRFPFHRFEERGPTIRDAFGDRVDVTLTTDREDLTALGGYDVVLDYLTDSTLTDARREGLLSFVADGGGYVGVHCAADLTSTESTTPGAVIDRREEPVEGLRELLGGQFRTHPEQTTFAVRVVDHYHPITATLSDFRVWDEPYVVDVDDDVSVLARMDHPEHADTPVAWTKRYGEGRVFYCSLGHGEPALTTPGVRALLDGGVRWAAGLA